MLVKQDSAQIKGRRKQAHNSRSDAEELIQLPNSHFTWLW